MSITIPETATYEPTEHPAVAYCLEAWRDEYQACRDGGMKDYDSREKANAAFRSVMPDLSDEQNILDFIACVGRGLLIKVFNSTESTKLLYAAQVASQSLSSMQRSRRAKPAISEPPATAAA